jgi:branched-chain amino acid transport system substrate-binding protein
LIRRAPTVALAVALVAMGLLLAGCGGGGDNSTTTGSSVLTVYSSLPLQGPTAAESRAVLNGEKLALIEQDGRIGDLTVKLVALDDATAQRQGWDPGQTSRNARRAVQDRSAIAYLGESDSGATAISLPILNSDSLLQVSPLSTYVGLTKTAGADKGEPEKYYPSGKRTFGRVVPADDVQAAAQLEWQAQDGCTRPFVLDDRSFDGRGIADEVRRQAVQDGRPVAGDASVAGESDIGDAVKAVTDSGADCVFFGGTQQSWTAALLTALHRALPEGRIYASAELATDQFVRTVPPAVQGSLRLTSPVLPTRVHPPAAAAFEASYRRTFRESAPPQAIYGYEAMKTILVSINNARGKGNDRDAVRRQFFRIRGRESVLGPYSIDADGDTTIDDYGLYEVRGGLLHFVRKLDTRKG